MICSNCFTHMEDYGEYLQCPHCNDIRPKCRTDKGVERFKQACLRRREPSLIEKVWMGIKAYRNPITVGVVMALGIVFLMVFR